jgi:hypothetical protein
MTDAIRRRSRATAVSRSTSEAMISTSYGVRFFERAARIETVWKLRSNSASCLSTSARTGWPRFIS